MVASLCATTVTGCTRRPAPSPPPVETTSAPTGLQAAARVLQQAAPACAAERPAPRTYAPDTMYEAIDGEADLFRSYDGQGLVTARYPVGTATVEAEIFDQGAPINAFGVFSQLRGNDSPPVEVGAQGVIIANEAVFFWKSRYFVRVTATGAGRPPIAKVVDFARDLAGGLTGSSQLPAWTAVLPAQGRTAAPQYVARNVLGHGFLANAMLADYGAGESRCTLALVRAGDEAAARKVWERLKKTYGGRAEEAALAGLGDERFLGLGREERPVRAVRAGRYLALVVGKCDAAEARRLLETTLDRL